MSLRSFFLECVQWLEVQQPSFDYADENVTSKDAETERWKEPGFLKNLLSILALECCLSSFNFKKNIVIR